MSNHDHLDCGYKLAGSIAEASRKSVKWLCVVAFCCAFSACVKSDQFYDTMPLGQSACVPDDYISNRCRSATCVSVFFERDSSEIGADAQPVIQTVLTLIRNQNPERLEIRSYSNNVADHIDQQKSAYQRVARDRLKTAVDAIVSSGYPADKIISSATPLQCLPSGGENNARTKRVEFIWN